MGRRWSCEQRVDGGGELRGAHRKAKATDEKEEEEEEEEECEEEEDEQEAVM